MTNPAASLKSKPFAVSSDGCPVCLSKQVAPFGQVFHPRAARVAGVPIDLGDQKYQLLRCDSCDFMFKDPPIDAEKLDRCYAAAGSGHWGYTIAPRSRHFDTIANALGTTPGRSILDVGCANGSFLSYLGPSWKRFGVEPSTAASAVARERGVTILGPTLADVRAHQFDVIINMDVLEHITDLHDFVKTASCLLAPGGILVTLTGDTASVPWRVFGSRYWYAGLPEHVSFHCAKSLDRLVKEHGLDPVSIQRMSHDRKGIVDGAIELAKSAAFYVLEKADAAGLSFIGSKAKNRNSPALLAFPDHLLHAARKLG